MIAAVANKLAKYPAKNPAWNLFEPESKFTIEDSTLAGNGNLDPWNRQMPVRSSWQAFYHGQGEDRELGGWNVTTTVEGVSITLTIFND